jgi:CubicO group peptidase (beta-lactamase class C family)
MESLTTFIKRALNTPLRLRYLSIFVITFGLLNGCGGGSNSDIKEEAEQIKSTYLIEQQIHTALGITEIDADFTLMVESNNGTQFSHNRGSSTSTTYYRSASTSKIVTASIILRLVQQGVLALDDHPQEYLDFWPATGNHAAIELRHLLNFTSGLTEDPLCLNLPNANNINCVKEIINVNPNISIPGNEYYYASSHLQVAGLMAIEASGLNNWIQVFDNFKLETQLFTNATYDLPSINNPRLAGGMHWQASEYMKFLSALYHQQVLSANMIKVMTSDQSGNAIMTYSPVTQWPTTPDWHYGFGLWIECPSVAFDCTTATRVSSAGAYGAYPFIDFKQKYFGIIAREGALGTGSKGYQIWTDVKDELAQWATINL